MASQKRKALLLRISGRVQGVGYRAWAKREADALGLAGWVRNEGDGSVTALVAGPKDAVAAMVERLEQGPRLAAVTSVAAEDAAEPDDSGFHITG